MSVRSRVFGVSRGGGDRHPHDVPVSERDHHPERAVVNGCDRSDPEARREHTVAGGRGAAALDMTEDRGAGLEAGAALRSRVRASPRSRRGGRGRMRRHGRSPSRAAPSSASGPSAGCAPSEIDDDRRELTARVPAAAAGHIPRRRRTELRGRGSRLLRRRFPCTPRSSPRGGPSPRRR